MRTSQNTRFTMMICVIVLLVLVGCSLQAQPIPSEQVTFHPTQPTNIPPTKTPFVSDETQLPLPSPSPVETRISPTLQTITPVPQPTLDPTQFAVRIQQFLFQGDDCQSPCFLGVIPGQTTLVGANEIFRQLGSPLSKESTKPSGVESFRTTMRIRNPKLSMGIQIMAYKGVVENIHSNIGVSENHSTPEHRDWSAIAPESLLRKYGPPSHVNFNLAFPPEAGFPPETAWYDLIMTYDHLDFSVLYFHGLSVDDDFIKACPLTDEFDSISVYIGKGQEFPTYIGKPLEEVTTLTITQFSDLLTQDSRPACFDISKHAMFLKK